MTKRMFSFVMMVCAMIGAVNHARAQIAPYQSVATLSASSTSVIWDAPAATYGPLLSLQALGLTNAATLKVDHIIAVTSAMSITNAVETAAAGDTLLAYPSSAVYTNGVISVKPVWLVPGDKLLFTASAANGGAVGRIVIRAGFPGN